MLCLILRFSAGAAIFLEGGPLKRFEMVLAPLLLRDNSNFLEILHIRLCMSSDDSV